jgi:putative endonuclease
LTLLSFAIPAGNLFLLFLLRDNQAMRFAYTYIMTNATHTVLYTGCTNDLVRRVGEHKSHFYKGSFADKYNCEYCVYYKEFNSYQSAIDEENRIKGLSRKAKIEMIEEKNPEWKELVTEKGFVYDKTPWSEKVKQVIDDLIKDQ